MEISGRMYNSSIRNGVWGEVSLVQEENAKKFSDWWVSFGTRLEACFWSKERVAVSLVGWGRWGGMVTWNSRSFGYYVP